MYANERVIRRKFAQWFAPTAVRPSGMLFRRKAEVEPQPESYTELRPRPNSDEDALVDTVGAVLRSFGEHCFDVGEVDQKAIRETFEQWARHVLLGAPPPGSPAPTGAFRRDWAALRRFVAEHRREEASFVTRSLRDLRQVIWDVARTVNQSAAEQATDSVVAHQQLARLKLALGSNDSAAVLREAGCIVQVVETVLSKQKARREHERSQLSQHIRTLGAQLDHARREGEIDPMTRVHNRASFDDYIARTVELSDFLATPAALIVTDIDNFKAINDTRGHAVGDRVIRAFADRLSLTFPRRGDFVARFGGDEFAVVLKDVTSGDANMLAQRLVDAVRKIRVPDGEKTLTFTASVGVAVNTNVASSAAWFAIADAALYRAKANGRDGWAAAED